LGLDAVACTEIGVVALPTCGDCSVTCVVVALAVAVDAMEALLDDRDPPPPQPVKMAKAMSAMDKEFFAMLLLENVWNMAS
jgi:hypothetical protein